VQRNHSASYYTFLLLRSIQVGTTTRTTSSAQSLFISTWSMRGKSGARCCLWTRICEGVKLRYTVDPYRLSPCLYRSQQYNKLAAAASGIELARASQLAAVAAASGQRPNDALLYRQDNNTRRGTSRSLALSWMNSCRERHTMPPILYNMDSKHGAWETINMRVQLHEMTMRVHVVSGAVIVVVVVVSQVE
jgi:hypothetical protein